MGMGGSRRTMARWPGNRSSRLRPERHIAGFSIRKDDGTEIPLIFEAAVGQAQDTVILKLTGAGARKGIALVRSRLRSLLQPDRRPRHGRTRLRADPARRGE